jgi:hypothetical protein
MQWKTIWYGSTASGLTVFGFTMLAFGMSTEQTPFQAMSAGILYVCGMGTYAAVEAAIRTEREEGVGGDADEGSFDESEIPEESRERFRE